MSRTKESRRTRLARGRTYLKAGLGWLSGLPLRQAPGRIIWLAFPRFGDRLPQKMTLRRRELRQATVTWRILTTRFARSLPQIVEEPAHWRDGVPRLISLLTEAVHQGTALPSSLFEISDFYPSRTCRNAQNLITERPDLRPWLAALSWLAYQYPSEAEEALAWSQQHPEELDIILAQNDGLAGVVLIQRLWSLTLRDGADLVAPLLRLLAQPLVYATPVAGARSYSEGWTQFLKEVESGKVEGDYPMRPEASIGETLAAFLAALVGRRRQERRHALALFDLVWEDELLPDWAAWWAETERNVQWAKQLTLLRYRSARRSEAKRLRQRLRLGLEQSPPPHHLEFTLAQIGVAATEAKLCDELIRILPLIPKVGNGALMRAALLTHWVSLLPEHRPQLPILLHCIRKSWQRVGNRPGLFEPWVGLFARWRPVRLAPPTWWPVELTILRRVPEQRLWPVICDTLAANAGLKLLPVTDHGHDGDEDRAEPIDPDILLSLAIMTEDATQAGALVSALAAQPVEDWYLPTDLLSFAYQLDGGRRHFGQLVAKLQVTFAQEEDFAIAALRVTVAHLETRGWQGLATDLILDGHVKRLVQLGQRLQVLAQFDLAVPPPSPLPPQEDIPDWINPYPQSLHPVLWLLASLHPAAQKAAGRILKKDFPDDSQLQQEIVVLRQKLAEDPAQPFLEQRLANLEQRLISPRPVSDQRMARLEEKLLRLVAQQALAVWEEEIDDALRPALAEEFAVGELPDWVFKTRQLQVIVNLLQLREEFRRLGLRLLRLRCGPPPWSLVDDPANKQFIAKMEQRGVQMEPWLNPPAPRSFTASNGRAVHLQFENDPLEIFQMGRYFNTCLSPGEFNFFSVFANAADVNKHVVYARNEQQQVVGRCLLALTEEGSLLTFEPYCHDPELGFTEMMAEVVTDLAEQMRVLIHLRGRVPSLVAPSWYDDGPRDVTGRFDFLEPKSDFRKALTGMTPDDFLQELETLFAPLPLNALSLTLILGLPELEENPTLILPLLPYLEAEKALPDHTMLQAVRLAYQAGEQHFVRRAIQSWAPAYLQRYRRYGYWPNADLVMMLAELDPSAALRFLRNTRPRGVRRDEEEEGWRREALAVAHENLSRYALAQKLRAGQSA